MARKPWLLAADRRARPRLGARRADRRAHRRRLLVGEHGGRQRAPRRPIPAPRDPCQTRDVSGRVSRWSRALVCALALAATGCLSATPPKTPNQREAERNAPHVVAPPPPDAGRTPRPAPGA